jgi:Zn-dependent protease with chaperone function
MKRWTAAPAIPGCSARRVWWSSLALGLSALVPLLIFGQRITTCLAHPPDRMAAGCSSLWLTVLCQPLVRLAQHFADSPLLVVVALPGVLIVILLMVSAGRVLIALMNGIRSARLVAQVIAEATVSASDPLAQRLARLTGGRMPSAAVLALPVPLALTYGLWHPRIAISTPLLRQLSDDAARAVLAHEGLHLARRDPLRRLVSHALTQAYPQWPLFGILEAHLHLRQEVEADAVARRAVGVQALAGALVTLYTSQTHQPQSNLHAPHRLVASMPQRRGCPSVVSSASRCAERIDLVLGHAGAVPLRIAPLLLAGTLLSSLVIWCLLVWP